MADAAAPPQSLGALLAWGCGQLTPSAGASARREAELLLGAATGLNRAALIAWPERAPDPPALACFARMIRRRCAGEPIAYLLGDWEFHQLRLHVTAATLIPRAETELLVDWALAQRPSDPPSRCADLGTGSGAIALAIAVQRPTWHILALDRSRAALSVAAANRARLQAQGVALIQGDWLEAIGREQLDLILANPPYVGADDPHLAQGDLRFEPREALVAGSDGLSAIARIAAAAPSRLRRGGALAIEHGWTQGAAVRALLINAGLGAIETHRDLAGHERCTSARRAC